ncbi:MAG: OmpA family protein [Bacteroidia bacterium]|nr:OmpA family protein [Bacteroidia bacterium]
MRLASITSLLLLSVRLIGQPVVYDTDEFDQRLRRWSCTGGSLTWGPGYVRLLHSGGPDHALMLRDAYLMAGKPWSLSADMVFEPGYNGAGGIVWSASADADQYYALMLKPTGEVSVMAVTPAGTRTLLPWTKPRKLAKPGQPNLLSLTKQGWRLYITLGGKPVEDLPFPPVTGYRAGVIVAASGAIQVLRFAIDHPPVVIPLIEGPELIARKRPLDSVINQPHTDETAPVLGFDRHTLFFSRADTGNPWYSGALMISRVQGDTLWGPARRISLPGNTRRHAPAWLNRDVTLAVTDGARLLHIDTTGTLLADDWPDEMTGTAKVSTWYLTPDRQTLLFAAIRPDGYGDLDLYVSFRQKGTWTPPLNLGPDINSPGRETCAWLAGDGKTLWFSTDGLPGYGRGDVWRTERLSSTWTQWASPVNLGPRINGPGWDGWYVPVPAADNHWYMASQDSLRGDFDVYGVRIPMDPVRMPLTFVRGQVTDRTTGAPVTAQVTARIISTDDSTLKSTEAPGGSYGAFLDLGKAYEVFAIAPGYYPVMDTVDVRSAKTYRETTLDLELIPLETGRTIQLEQVFFERATAVLLPTSRPELDRLVMLMLAMPGLVIEIQGHTDNIGSEDELLLLSEARARMVRSYLMARGVDPSRMVAVGFGSMHPIASNETPETRRLNRRVAFRILSQ